MTSLLNLMIIVNTFLKLGENMFDSTVRKIVKYLLEKFQPKLTAIEESKDVDKSKLDELVSNLKCMKLIIIRKR